MAEYFGYLKVSAVGAAGGQQIVNTFYYGNDVGEPISINDPMLAAFGTAWLSAFGEDYLGEQTDAYTASQVEVSAVDERGVTLSENTAEVAFVGTGDIAQAIPGPGLAAILSIKTSGVSSNDSVALKRSYIAWGPVPAAFVEADGDLTLLALAAYANIAALVMTPIVFGLQEFGPVRIGRTVAPAASRVGTIISCTVRPAVRFRDSRMKRADGV